jgi:hypothetical protein
MHKDSSDGLITIDRMFVLGLIVLMYKNNKKIHSHDRLK